MIINVINDILHKLIFDLMNFGTTYVLRIRQNSVCINRLIKG